MKPNWALLTFYVFVAFVAVVGVLPYAFLPSGPLDMHDAENDQQAIVAALRHAPYFTDTFKWFTGSWIDSLGAYFRPVPSLLYWIEYRIVGESITGFMAVHWVSQVACTLVVFGFLLRLFSLRSALVIITIWTLSLPQILGLPSPAPSLFRWKDSVEFWFGILAFGFLWAWLRYSETPSRARLVVAAVLFIGAIGTKEMGYILPGLALLVGWLKGYSISKRGFALICGMAVVCLAYRHIALHGVVFRNGSNGAMTHRMFNNVLGPNIVTPMESHDFLVWSGAFFMAAPCLAFFRKWRAAAACFGAGAALCLLTDVFQGDTLGTSITRLTIYPSWLNVVTTVITGVLWWNFSTTRPKEQLFACAWAVVSYAPLTVTYTTAHALYFPSIAWAIWIAVPVSKILESVQVPVILRPASAGAVTA